MSHTLSFNNATRTTLISVKTIMATARLGDINNGITVLNSTTPACIELIDCIPWHKCSCNFKKLSWMIGGVVVVTSSFTFIFIRYLYRRRNGGAKDPGPVRGSGFVDLHQAAYTSGFARGPSQELGTTSVNEEDISNAPAVPIDVPTTQAGPSQELGNTSANEEDISDTPAVPIDVPITQAGPSQELDTTSANEEDVLDTLPLLTRVPTIRAGPSQELGTASANEEDISDAPAVPNHVPTTPAGPSQELDTTNANEEDVLDTLPVLTRVPTIQAGPSQELGTTSANEEDISDAPAVPTHVSTTQAGTNSEAEGTAPPQKKKPSLIHRVFENKKRRYDFGGEASSSSSSSSDTPTPIPVHTDADSETDNEADIPPHDGASGSAMQIPHSHPTTQNVGNTFSVDDLGGPLSPEDRVPVEVPNWYPGRVLLNMWDWYEPNGSSSQTTTEGQEEAGIDGAGSSEGGDEGASQESSQEEAEGASREVSQEEAEGASREVSQEEAEGAL